MNSTLTRTCLSFFGAGHLVDAMNAACGMEELAPINAAEFAWQVSHAAQA